MNNIRNRQRVHAARETQRGMTLIEIMIVIIIMSLIATGVSLGVMKQLEKSRLKDASMGACTIRSAVQLYQAENPNQCPDMSTLEEGYLDSKMRVQDPWKQDYVIECEDGESDVYSKGKDGSGRIACERENKE